MGLEDLKVAFCGFFSIISFFTFKAPLAVSFVGNASAFPADMHKGRYVAMPHTASSAVMHNTDLGMRFFRRTFKAPIGGIERFSYAK